MQIKYKPDRFVWSGTVQEFRNFLRSLVNDPRTLRDYINGQIH